MSGAVPTPTPELAARLGSAVEDYEKVGREHRMHLGFALPPEWTFEGRRVLDFGCGTGRTLATFVQDGVQADLVGCDIHADSIAWASSRLSPPCSFFVCEDGAPLPLPDHHFDLVYAMSVFTHITGQWSHWLSELHRVMRPDAMAVITVLGPAMAPSIIGSAWDDRIGMACVNLHRGWDVGGPDVLLAEWWVREHWGRAFEILHFDRCEPSHGAGHDFAVMRPRHVPVTAELLEAVELDDPRELASAVCNLEILSSQQRALGQQLREAQNARLGAEREAERLRARMPESSPQIEAIRREQALAEAETQRLQDLLQVITSSNSWRLTAPLRSARTITGKRRPRKP